MSNPVLIIHRVAIGQTFDGTAPNPVAGVVKTNEGRVWTYLDDHGGLLEGSLFAPTRGFCVEELMVSGEGMASCKIELLSEGVRHALYDEIGANHVLDLKRALFVSPEESLVVTTTGALTAIGQMRVRVSGGWSSSVVITG